MSYETTRRNRTLGYGIDTAITGVKNIIVTCNSVQWDETEAPFVEGIDENAKFILGQLLLLEEKLLALAPVYDKLIRGGVKQSDNSI